MIGLGAALAWFLDTRAFVSVGQSIGHVPTASSLPPRGLGAPRHAPTAAFSDSSARTSVPKSSTSVAFGAFLLAAAAVGRRRNVTARRVTYQEIQDLTIKQVPKWFRPKISIGMARRGAVVKAIRKTLDKTYFMMAYNKDGTDCASLRKSRALFPDSVIVRSLKNSLVKKAMERTEWEDFGKNLKGSLMYVFVMDENDVKPTVQAYLKLEKEFNRAAQVARVYETVKNQIFYTPRPLIGGCLRDDWKLIGPEEFVKLKDAPTKTELIGKVAFSIKAVTQKLAVGVKQVPQKLAIGTKKIVEKMEEDGKATVGDVVV